MAYLHIENLYKNQDILKFEACYALEKIHGTSAHIKFHQGVLSFFSGGESYDRFVSLFDKATLVDRFETMFPNKSVTIFGEAYGGRQQGMSGTYGTTLKFIAFDIQIEDTWSNVPDANIYCDALGLEFVSWNKIATDMASIDAERDAPSVQAVRNGIIEPKPREGVVLRPLIETTNQYGERLIAKHKNDTFRETASPRVVDDPAKLKVLEDAEQIATEWVTMTRLEHVLDKLPGFKMEQMPVAIAAMIEDVIREAHGEIVDSKAVRAAISKKTAFIVKKWFENKMRGGVQ